jgi:hypothetical protein
LPTADPPDGPTRAENSLRMKKLAPSLRRFVTVAIGDDFRVSVVRTVMRAISVLQGKAKVHLVANTVEEGIRRMLEAGGPTTPGPVQLTQDVQARYRALGWTSGTSDQPSMR